MKQFKEGQIVKAIESTYYLEVGDCRSKVY